MEVRADQVGAEDVPQGGENLLDLALHERYSAANPGCEPFVNRLR